MSVPVRPGVTALPLEWADLARFDSIIDVRTPAEFVLDAIPSAINCPVLSNDERIQVGTLHKQSGAFEAKRVGAVLVARNVAQHIESQFSQQPKGWRPLIYCWRGGARSGAMTHILRSIGWNASQLDGGYKAWRAHLVKSLEQLAPKFTFRVICGRTGSGKSRLLEALARAGRQVLDLEQLAEHKGSVLGDMPNQPQPTQKQFESRLWAKLSAFDSAEPVFVEAESRKIGALRVVPALIERMWQGQCIELEIPLDARCALLREEYAHLIRDPALLNFKLDCLAHLHSKALLAQWKQLAAEGAWDEFVTSMLHDHYDPAYGKSMFRNYQHADKALRVTPAGISVEAFDRLAGAI